MNHKLMLLAGTHLATFTLGFQLAPREMLDTEVRQSGLFRSETLGILSATVTSLRSENKLTVYAYKGDARVSVSRSLLWLFEGHQELIVPASVTYHLDLTKLAPDAVRFDPAAKLVTVRLPALVLGEVAFQPEAARTINGGLLSVRQSQVDELSRLNYASARKTFVKQAQDPTLVATAKREGVRNVQAYFAVPLRATGRSDIRVLAHFTD